VAKRTSQEREARVAWILDHARDLAVEDGLESVTITRLAERTGYTVGAFYRYWSSLEELLAALHRRTAELFYDAMWSALPPARAKLERLGKRHPPSVNALADLVVLLLLYRRLAAAHPKHFELIGQLVTRGWKWIDEAEQSRLNALVLPRVAEVIGVVECAAKLKALAAGDPVERTVVLWIGVHASLSIGPLAERHPDLIDRDRLVTSMCRTLLSGMGASEKDLRTAFRLAETSIEV
jgi:AcrR family transcriptional regulator